MRCRRGYSALGALTVGVSLLLSGCAGSHLGLASSDIPSDLGLQSDPGAFNLVAGGAGLITPRRVNESTTCSVAFYDAFIPPGRSGEAAGGEGVTFTYAEVLTIGWRCPSSQAAVMVFGGSQVLSEGGSTVTGVAEQATLLNVGNQPNQGYPDDRVFCRHPLVGEAGLEPAHPFGHRNLNPARLPIPPLARATGQQ